MLVIILIFQEYPAEFASKLRNIRKDYADGGIVIRSNGIRKRIPVFMTLVGAGSPKLLHQFKIAKSLMKESGLITPGRIDIQLPDFEIKVLGSFFEEYLVERLAEFCRIKNSESKWTSQRANSNPKIHLHRKLAR